MPDIEKHAGLLALYDRIGLMTRSPGSNASQEDQGCCPNCLYRFDPLLNRREAWAYTGFKPGTLAVWDCTKAHDLQPIRFGNAVRYRLSSLNSFVNARIRP